MKKGSKGKKRTNRHWRVLRINSRPWNSELTLRNQQRTSSSASLRPTTCPHRSSCRSLDPLGLGTCLVRTLDRTRPTLEGFQLARLSGARRGTNRNKSTILGLSVLHTCRARSWCIDLRLNFP